MAPWKRDLPAPTEGEEEPRKEDWVCHLNKTSMDWKRWEGMDVPTPLWDGELGLQIARCQPLCIHMEEPAGKLHGWHTHWWYGSCSQHWCADGSLIKTYRKSWTLLIWGHQMFSAWISPQPCCMTVTLSQAAYINTIMCRFSMQDSHPVSTRKITICACLSERHPEGWFSRPSQIQGDGGKKNIEEVRKS